METELVDRDELLPTAPGKLEWLLPTFANSPGRDWIRTWAEFSVFLNRLGSYGGGLRGSSSSAIVVTLRLCVFFGKIHAPLHSGVGAYTCRTALVQMTLFDVVSFERL